MLFKEFLDSLLMEVIIIKSRIEEMNNFAKLLKCKSYGEILDLKRELDDDMYDKITSMYERLYIDDLPLEIIVQEKIIDLTKIDSQKIDEELKDIIKILLTTSIKQLDNLKINTASDYVKKIYNDTYEMLLKQRLIKNKSNYLDIKVTSIIK